MALSKVPCSEDAWEYGAFFDHDAFMHYALHVLDVPGLRDSCRTSNREETTGDRDRQRCDDMLCQGRRTI